MPYRHEGGKRVRIDSWEGHVDRMIREATERGEFDDLPGAGKPLDLEENPFAGEWQSAFRIARNAGAAHLWVELDREIAADSGALREMAERTARYLALAQARQGDADAVAPSGADRPPGRTRGRAGSWWWRLLFGPPGRAAGAAGVGLYPQTPADLEAERRRARRLYLERAAAVDEKIRDYNNHRPRSLTWLEKPRLTQEDAARDFDALCPPLE
jgi:DnaJ homologue, subfamily C, member 28, conserved domain